MAARVIDEVLESQIMYFFYLMTIKMNDEFLAKIVLLLICKWQSQLTNATINILTLLN